MTNKTKDTEPLQPYIEISNDAYGNAIFTLNLIQDNAGTQDIIVTHKPRKITQALKALEDISGQKFIESNCGTVTGWKNVKLHFSETCFSLSAEKGTKLIQNASDVELINEHSCQTFDDFGETNEVIQLDGMRVSAFRP